MDPKNYVLIGVGAMIALMLAFPPYHVLGGEGRVVGTGYSFIFDLPWRASVNVGQLMAQWLGVVLVGGVIYLLLGKR